MGWIMAQLNISIDELSNNVNMLRKNVEIIRSSLREIKRINDELQQCWIGDQIEIFQNKLDHCEQMSISELTELCEKFSNYMEEVARIYRSTEEQLFSKFFGEG